MEKNVNLIAKKSLAFTLAEVLITLAVIGIVAALTIPTVVRNYQKHQTVTRLKKTYSALSNTTNLAIADNGPIQGWELTDGATPQGSLDFAQKYLLPYLKISKNCELEITQYCEFGNKPLNKTDNTRTLGAAYARFYLNDGTFIAVRSYQDLETTTNHKKYAVVFIDVNGQKGPNTLGKDVFSFEYLIDCLVPRLNGKFVPKHVDLNRATLTSDTGGMCNRNQSGDACPALIMKDGWQIKDDYPW